MARIYEVLKRSPSYCFLTKKKKKQQNPPLLAGEMKNSRVLSKVRDAENGARRIACQKARKKKKNFLCSVACERIKEEDKSG